MQPQLREVFDRSFRMAQSQCALILGNRTSSVPALIAQTSQLYSATLITLSGLLCPEDLQALQTVATQLSKSSKSEYSDSGFLSTLTYIRDNLKKSSKIVIAIYDIQEYAHRNLKQTLLYTLFEMVHEDLCMICVIGVTNRLDFTEMLEKRIKSRFSYQSIMGLDMQILENTMEGIELEENYTKIVQQLKPFHLTVLISYIKVSLKKNDLTLVSAFKEYQSFKDKNPMIVYDIDQFTFGIVTSYLLKSCLIKVQKPHMINRFTTYTLSFDPESILYSIKCDSIEVPTALQEWALGTN